MYIRIQISHASWNYDWLLESNPWNKISYTLVKSTFDVGNYLLKAKALIKSIPTQQSQEQTIFSSAYIQDPNSKFSPLSRYVHHTTQSE